MPTRLCIAAIALISTSSAMASTPVGFMSKSETLRGSEPDEYLSADAVTAAALSGIRDAGVMVDTAVHGDPEIVFVFSEANAPSTTRSTSREVDGLLELQVAGTVLGKERSDGVCIKTIEAWYGGGARTSREYDSLVLDGIRAKAKEWAASCFQLN